MGWKNLFIKGLSYFYKPFYLKHLILKVQILFLYFVLLLKELYSLQQIFFSYDSSTHIFAISLKLNYKQKYLAACRAKFSLSTNFCIIFQSPKVIGPSYQRLIFVRLSIFHWTPWI